MRGRLGVVAIDPNVRASRRIRWLLDEAEAELMAQVISERWPHPDMAHLDAQALYDAADSVRREKESLR